MSTKPGERHSWHPARVCQAFLYGLPHAQAASRLAPACECVKRRKSCRGLGQDSFTNTRRYPLERHVHARAGVLKHVPDQRPRVVEKHRKEQQQDRGVLCQSAARTRPYHTISIACRLVLACRTPRWIRNPCTESPPPTGGSALHPSAPVQAA